MEPVRNDTTTDRRTAVELAKRLLVDSIWRTAKIEVDGLVRDAGRLREYGVRVGGDE